ncbi:hypothetical protein GJ629_13095, partial [Halapricum sp. CBA1109]|uniref:hypothetical protein n=1 Tax=Halapricum sp. CBA1109 TaxID=2668068 RepID=UPI0012FB6CA2
MTEAHTLGRGPSGPDAAADGYHWTIEDGQVAAVSADLARVTRRNASALLGLGPLDLFADATAGRSGGALGRCLGDGDATTTATLSGRDGRAETVTVRFVRVDDEDGDRGESPPPRVLTTRSRG